jgi:hypothetical protein
MDLIDDSPAPQGNQPEYTVSELSGAVKRVIEGEFGSAVKWGGSAVRPWGSASPHRPAHVRGHRTRGSGCSSRSAWSLPLGVIGSSQQDGKRRCKGIRVRDSGLWQRLQDYGFPLSDGRGTLEEHLIAKAKFGAVKAARAIEEYRRFLYLAATAGEPVAPSQLVDRVWHAHIIDTRAYVDDFATKVTGRIIHHRPGRPDAADDPAYQRTLHLYEEEFGEMPFRKVWPSADWLKGANKRQILVFGSLVASALLSPAVQFPLPFVVWPAVIAVSAFVDIRYGYWTVSARIDGSGCSSSDGGGCGGD